MIPDTCSQADQSTDCSCVRTLTRTRTQLTTSSFVAVVICRGLFAVSSGLSAGSVGWVGWPGFLLNNSGFLHSTKYCRCYPGAAAEDKVPRRLPVVGPCSGETGAHSVSDLG